MKDLSHGIRASQHLTNLYTEAKNATMEENLKETSVSSLIAEAYSQCGIKHENIVMSQEQQDFTITIDSNIFSLIFGSVVLLLQQETKSPIRLKFECSKEN